MTDFIAWQTKLTSIIRTSTYYKLPLDIDRRDIRFLFSIIDTKKVDQTKIDNIIDMISAFCMENGDSQATFLILKKLEEYSEHNVWKMLRICTCFGIMSNINSDSVINIYLERSILLFNKTLKIAKKDEIYTYLYVRLQYLHILLVNQNLDISKNILDEINKIERKYFLGNESDISLLCRNFKHVFILLDIELKDYSGKNLFFELLDEFRVTGKN